MTFVLGTLFGIYLVGVLMGAVLIYADGSEYKIGDLIFASSITLFWPLGLAFILVVGLINRVFHVQLF